VVAGTLTEPRTEVRTLNSLKRSWQDLFGGGERPRSVQVGGPGDPRISGQ